MGAHDRPFPPAGLPPRETKIFQAAYVLAYHPRFLVAKERQVELGHGRQVARRSFGNLEIEVEFVFGNFEFSPATKFVRRYWVRIWHRNEADSAMPVFSAWCSRSHDDHDEALVVTDHPGTLWEEYLIARLALEVVP